MVPTTSKPRPWWNLKPAWISAGTLAKNVKAPVMAGHVQRAPGGIRLGEVAVGVEDAVLLVEGTGDHLAARIDDQRVTGVEPVLEVGEQAVALGKRPGNVVAAHRGAVAEH